MVDKFQNNGGCVSRGFEEGATIDRDKLVRVRLRDPDVATGVGEPLGIGVHAKLHLASAIPLVLIKTVLGERPVQCVIVFRVCVWIQVMEPPPYLFNQF